MAVQDNRPQLSQLLQMLSTIPSSVLSRFDPNGDGSFPLLQQQLANSIALIEDQGTTAFNGGIYTPDNPELYDGNTTNQIMVRHRPILSIQLLQVVTPILGYVRVYTPEEIKNYSKQGAIKVFTYKLAVEQALMQSVDFQAWGSLFPPLPQAVQVAYTYGYPLYDPEQGSSFDYGITWDGVLDGSGRDYEMLNWLTNLQQAALCDAAASFLSQSAGLAVGIFTSVSFDGLSKGMNAAAFQAQATALLAKRDELMGRRARRFIMSTVGGS